MVEPQNLSVFGGENISHLLALNRVSAGIYAHTVCLFVCLLSKSVSFTENKRTDACHCLAVLSTFEVYCVGHIGGLGGTRNNANRTRSNTETHIRD